MQTKQNIKPVSQQVQIISVLPQEIDKFWGLVEFLIAEALKYGGSYADLKDIKEELEKDREYRRNWEKNNRDKVQEYKKRTLEKHPSLKIANNVRTRMYQTLKDINKHEPTLKLLGCSIKDYKLYLESKFDENMSWDNYGTYWEIDHIKELYKFDLTQYNQQMEAFNFTNTQPLTIPENRKKR